MEVDAVTFGGTKRGYDVTIATIQTAFHCVQVRRLENASPPCHVRTSGVRIFTGTASWKHVTGSNSGYLYKIRKSSCYGGKLGLFIQNNKVILLRGKTGVIYTK